MSSNLITALQRSLDIECEHISELDIVEHQFSAKFEKKMKKLIQRREKPYFELISTAGRRAACVIVALAAISASVFSVKAVREAVYDFIVKHFADHDEVTVICDDDCPQTIQDEYCISKIPDAFTETEYSKDSISIYAVYSADNDKYIVFGQYAKPSYNMFIDNEHTTLDIYTDSDDQTYSIYETYEDHIIIWDNGEYVFEISGNLNKDEMLELCRSIKIK